MTFVITAERLTDLARALENGDDITPAMRRALIDALNDLSLYHMIEEKRHQRGTPIAAATWLAARIADRLMTDYGVTKQKEAVWAAAPQADQKEHNRITRALQKLRKGEAPIRWPQPPHPHLVDQAADNINSRRLEEYITQKTRNK